jgi:hypothetical protein
MGRHQPHNQNNPAPKDKPPKKRLQATLVLILITINLGIYTLTTILNLLGLFPPSITTFVSTMEGIVVIIISLFAISTFTNIVKTAYLWLTFGISVLFVGALVVLYFVLPNSITGNPNPPWVLNWLHYYSWSRPYCNDTGEWMIASPKGTSVDCSHQTLLMWQEQHLPEKHLYYAEVDLSKIKGQATYNQESFKFTTTVTFTNPADVKTEAVLEVQTPKDKQGGFGLAVDPDGNCQGERYGKDLIQTELPCKGVALQNAIMTITVMVINHMFYGFINGTLVVSAPDDLQSGQLGYMVELTNQSNPSSRIQFSNANLYTM